MKLKVLITLFAFALVGYAFQAKPWPVPDKYQQMKNPVKADATSLSDGKSLYIKHCQSCHGKSGKGDGSKSAQLKTDPGDFSAAAFQKQTDGALLYKIAEGRNDMPEFKKKIPDEEDLWSVINYVRTLK